MNKCWGLGAIFFKNYESRRLNKDHGHNINLYENMICGHNINLYENMIWLQNKSPT
jgi:hypothetical protein